MKVLEFLRFALLSVFFSATVYGQSGYFSSFDNNYLLMYKDAQINVYSKSLKQTEYIFSLDDGNIENLIISKDSKYLAASNGTSLYIWELKTGNLLSKYTLASQPVRSILFELSKKAVLVLYKSKKFEVFEFQNKKGITKSDLLEEGINEEEVDSIASLNEKEFITIDVLYGTNRRKTGDKQYNDYFGKSFGRLSYGLAHVSIPVIHKAGEIERPDWFKFEFKEDPRKHVMIQELQTLSLGNFNQYLKNSFSKMGKKDVLIFIHGFSNRFDEAIRRTGQLAYDLDFPGVAMTYSWPSQGSFSVSNYEQDEVFSKKSIPYLKKFLLNVVKNSPGQKINIIAHSMGNRVLTNAIAEIEKKSKDHVFHQVILAAPDVNAKVFKEEIFPKMKGKVQNITLYASSDDNALMASRILNQQSRLGESGEFLTVVDGMDTIDSTGVDPSTMGHSYFSSTRTLLDDIKDLVVKGKEPVTRNLQVKRSESLEYWKMILKSNTNE